MTTDCIFIIDDNPDTIWIWKREIRHLKFKGKVHFFDEGEEAIKKLDSIFPKVIITDFWLQGEGFGEHIKAIRSHRPMTPIIVYSNYPSEKVEGLSYNYGASFFIELSGKMHKDIKVIQHMLQHYLGSGGNSGSSTASSPSGE